MTALCPCGAPARGAVPADDVCPAHVCRMCSPKHCLLGALYREQAYEHLRAREIVVDLLDRAAAVKP